MPLYPLQNANKNKATLLGGFFVKKNTAAKPAAAFDQYKNRGDRIWTCDLSVPNAARYQTTLHPDNKNHYTTYSGLSQQFFSKLEILISNQILILH